MRFLFKLIILIIVVCAGLAVWVWSGRYDIGADAPHWTLTRQLISTLRDRSVEVRVGKISVPNLDDPALLREGAEHYTRMCTGCHLAPGMNESEMRAGLYPEPPDLTRFVPDPAKAFWVIKHGIKMSAMPAWGKTHDDQKIWAMVAYLQEQPTLSAERYRELNEQAAHERMHEHEQAAHVQQVPDEPAVAPASTASQP